jgi:hypothetical protein
VSRSFDLREDATDIIGAAWGYQAKLVVLPADWLGDEFFRLAPESQGKSVQTLLDHGVRWPSWVTSRADRLAPA